MFNISAKNIFLTENDMAITLYTDMQLTSANNNGILLCQIN